MPSSPHNETACLLALTIVFPSSSSRHATDRPRRVGSWVATMAGSFLHVLHVALLTSEAPAVRPTLDEIRTRNLARQREHALAATARLYRGP